MEPATSPSTGDRAVVRLPNHVGELVLALPAVRHLLAMEDERPVLQVSAALLPLLELAKLEADVLPLTDRRRVWRAAAEVRRVRPARAILLTPSFSAAFIFYLAGVPARRGTSTDGRSRLLTDPVDRVPLLQDHRVWEYLQLVDPAFAPQGAPPRPRLSTDVDTRGWAELERDLDVPRGVPRVGLFPGSGSSSRRWPVDRFATLAHRLAGVGLAVLVFGGPDEGGLTAAVADGSPAVVDLGGRTSLAALAAGFATCAALVANDTGPMHIADALDRPVIALFGAGDPRQTGPLGSRSRVLRHSELACVPCLENRCPRTGRGDVLADANKECLALITVDEVERALGSVLENGVNAAAGGEGSPDE